MDPKSAELLSFFQENTLWQFFSRTWDRTEAIDGIFAAILKLQRGETLPRETLIEKAFYADAAVTYQQLTAKFSWLPGLSAVEAAEVFGATKAELVDIVLTKSKNEELSAELY